MKQINLLLSKKKQAGQASVTVYLCLIMVLIMSLLSALILSVRVQAGRAQTANSVDQALFSLFARYDRDLLEDYDVFFIDGTFGGTKLDMGACRDEIKDAMTYILQPNKGHTALAGSNMLKLDIEEASVKGYTLATDVNGEIFAAQAIAYMKETAGIQAAEAVLTYVSQAESQSNLGSQAENNAANINYDDYVAESQANQEAAGNEATPEDEEADEDGEEFENPIPIINKLRRLTIYNLVVPNQENISKKKVFKWKLLSGRRAASGVGVIRVPESAGSRADGLIFNEYVMSHCGSYVAPTEPSALAYQIEYVLGGKTSDKANLKAVINQLLLVREGANVLYLSADPARQGEIQTAATAVASLLLLPEAAPFFATLITAGWAFAESLVDVRALLSGKRVAAVKDASTWQVGLNSLKTLLTSAGLDGLTADVPGGLDYEAYLRILLAMRSRGKVIKRTMDMVESTIRAKGREDFRLDTCIDAVTFTTKVRSEGRVSFTLEKSVSYRDY